MKNTILNTIMLLLCTLIFEQCAIINAIVNSEYPEYEREENGECFKWNNSPVIAVLRNEPAYIRRGCHTESDLFYIELVNAPIDCRSNWVYPCNGIPEKFQVDRLPVLVSGNILRAEKFNLCRTPSRPDVWIPPDNIFELKTIVLNENKNGSFSYYIAIVGVM